jgi:cob(I)alamin adenosyltransferase
VINLNSKGCIHIYTGDGKGKTTASIGLAVRAQGAGLKVLFVQFLKGQQTSELEPLKKIGVTVKRADAVTKFIPYMTEQEKQGCFQGQQSCFKETSELLDNYDVVILDEVIGAVTTGMLPLAEVINMIKTKPEHLELVLTGRQPPEELVELADYVSEIKAIKHPYDKGIKARKGIEY